MITKNAENKDQYKNHLIFTDAARDAWKLILQHLKPNAKILLPSYIGITDREGSGIFDPVIEMGLSYDFYDLNTDLSISYGVLEQSIHKTEYDLILLVHYFGFKIQNIKAIIALCKKNNLIVVEDCAHLFNYSIPNYSDAGSFGDFAFYSLHKFFPITKGGLLVQNTFGYSSFDVKPLESTLSFDFITYDIQAIAQKRIENFKFLDQLISEVPGVKPLKQITKGIFHIITPYLSKMGYERNCIFGCLIEAFL